jgi:hypothetical protein
MSTETKIDLVEIRHQVRRAQHTDEPYDAADQWATLGYHVPELVDEIARLRTRVTTITAQFDELCTLVLDLAADLERYAADLRPEKLPMSERKLAGLMRKIVETAREATS